jgi:predicted nucleotidyltransferase
MSAIATTELPLTKIRSVARRVCDRHPVARLEVFGSRAGGTSGAGSDVDLLVEFLPGATSGLLGMGALHEDLEEQLGCRVDLLSRRPVEHSRNVRRRDSILARPVTVHARASFPRALTHEQN